MDASHLAVISIAPLAGLSNPGKTRSVGTSKFYAAVPAELMIMFAAIAAPET